MMSLDAALSSGLARIFRGKLCQTLLLNRSPIGFARGDVIYEVGDGSRTFFFIQSGFVRVGTLTEGGDEIIFDVRKDGDVIGELCASTFPRRDRAVALEPTVVIAVDYADILDSLQKNTSLLRELVAIFCDSLSDAYEQASRLAVDDMEHRLIKVLLDLAAKLGRADGQTVEIPVYLTQEEISQMVGARRERVSTALNALRRGGLVRYSRRGHLLLDVGALRNRPI